jgi:hypothetical protein
MASLGTLLSALGPPDVQAQQEKGVNAMASSTTDTAAALAGRSISICCWMYCEAIWVSRGMLPPMRTTEPYSPMARANASPVPLTTAGASVGSTTRRNVVQLSAPSEAAASSTSRSASMSTGCTERTTKGRVTNVRATISPHFVALRWMLTGLFGP